MTTTPTDRAAFEAWAEKEAFCLHRDDSEKYRDYHRATTRWAWQAWQAATAAERERAAKVCEGMHDEDRPGDYAHAIRSGA